MATGCREELDLASVIFWTALYDGMEIGSHCVHIQFYCTVF